MFEKIFDALKRKFKANKISAISPDAPKINHTFVFEKLIPLTESESDIIVTVTGINHYYGKNPFEIGTEVRFIKEPSNKYDSKAIAVYCDGIGKCGYIANSDYTVKQGTVSAEIVHGGVRENCVGEVLWADENYVLCSLKGITFYSLLMKYGIDYCHSKDFDSAYALFSAMEEKFPTPELYCRISYCCIKKNDRNTALIYAEKAVNSGEKSKRTELLFEEINNMQI